MIQIRCPGCACGIHLDALVLKAVAEAFDLADKVIEAAKGADPYTGLGCAEADTAEAAYRAAVAKLRGAP